MAACDADVVALQEVTKRTLPEWEAALRAAGYAAIECALGGPASGRRELGVLTAARAPLERLPSPDVPWPERVLCCAWEGIEVVNLHSPIAPAPDLAKIRTHEAVAAYLDAEPRSPRILCGDLNTPRRELPDGEVLTSRTTAPGGCGPSAASAGTAPSARSCARCATPAGSTPSARCTATATARRAGPSRKTAAAGAWTTCSCTGWSRRARLRARLAARRAERPLGPRRGSRRPIECVDAPPRPRLDPAGRRHPARGAAVAAGRSGAGPGRPRVHPVPQGRRVRCARPPPPRVLRRPRLRRRAGRPARQRRFGRAARRRVPARRSRTTRWR